MGNTDSYPYPIKNNFATDNLHYVKRRLPSRSVRNMDVFGETNVYWEMPSGFMNANTHHVIYVRDCDVDIALRYMQPWTILIHNIIRPNIFDRNGEYAKIIVLLNNNIFYLEAKDSSIQEQSWFFGNQII
jgi:hypothetical protein